MPQDKKDKNLNVPPLRFPGFTDEWKDSYLSLDCEVNPKSPILEDEFVYLDLESVEKGVLIKRQVIKKVDAPSRAQRVLSDGDVLFQCVRPYQQNNYFYEVDNSGLQWVASTGYAQLRVKHSNPEFIYHLLSSPSFTRKVIVRCTGSNYPAINSEDLSSIHYRICSLPEQKKIAKLITLLDERIAAQNKIIDNLQSLIKGLNDSFHDGIQGTPISFDQIGSSYSGLSGKNGDDFGHGSPFITYLNVYQNNIVNEKQIDLVSVDANESQNTISYGDVLFTLSSETPEETGIGCVYLGSSGKYYLNSFCFGVTITHPDKVYSPYLAYLVSSSKFRKFVYPLAQGSTRFNLQKSDFMRKQFTLLPIEKQKEIATILDTLNNRLSVEYKLNELYKSQKDYLLRKLFI